MRQFFLTCWNHATPLSGINLVYVLVWIQFSCSFAALLWCYCRHLYVCFVRQTFFLHDWWSSKLTSKLLMLRHLKWSDCCITTFMVHQIFLLTRDWFRGILWTNVPQLNWVICESITQVIFPNFKPYVMREDFAVVTEEGKSFLVVKAVPENTQKKTSLPCMK